ncbi:hypothetical protein IWQ60_011359, partial [Tieghemiomyces parasiticus]
MTQFLTPQPSGSTGPGTQQPRPVPLTSEVGHQRALSTETGNTDAAGNTPPLVSGLTHQLTVDSGPTRTRGRANSMSAAAPGSLARFESGDVTADRGGYGHTVPLAGPPPVGVRTRRSKSISETIMTRRASLSNDVLAYVYYPNKFTSPTVSNFPTGPFLPPSTVDADLNPADRPSQSPTKVAPIDNPLPAVAPAFGDKTTFTWEPTLERTIKAIVSIKANTVRSFDTESSGT